MTHRSPPLHTIEIYWAVVYEGWRPSRSLKDQFRAWVTKPKASLKQMLSTDETIESLKQQLEQAEELLMNRLKRSSFSYEIPFRLRFSIRINAIPFSSTAAELHAAQSRRLGSSITASSWIFKPATPCLNVTATIFASIITSFKFSLSKSRRPNVRAYFSRLRGDSGELHRRKRMEAREQLEDPPGHSIETPTFSQYEDRAIRSGSQYVGRAGRRADR